MQEPEFSFRLATVQDKPAIVEFMNTHWGQPHPLVNDADFFNFYYATATNELRFAIAEYGNKLAAIAGYIPANSTPNPDIWVSLWVSDPAYSGAGLALMAEIQNLTQCRTLACNNIRPKTQVLYQFLGYTTGRVGHFYRLADKNTYHVAKIANKNILPKGGSAILQKVEYVNEFTNSKFSPPVQHNPYKDRAYLAHRYFAYPHQKYDVWLATHPISSESALLVTRTTQTSSSFALRIVDYIGDSAFFAQLGNAIAALMERENAEYADFYCVGIPTETLHSAGFTERLENDSNIIPNYLTPLLQENIDFYYFTNTPENFTLFKADGDQDRPNIPQK